MSAIIQGKGDVFGPVGAVAGNIPLFDGTSGKIIKDDGISPIVLGALPRGWLSGMTLANNITDATNDVNIAAGKCRDDTDSADIVIGTALTKQLDVAWAAGTNAGGRDTGAIADSGWYMYAIRNPATGVCDVLFTSASPPANPTMPSGFTQKRRIGWVLRVSSAIVAFRQYGDYFQYSAPRGDINAATQTPAQFTAYALPSIPYGMKFLCHLAVRAGNNSGSGVVEVRDNDQGGTGPGTIFIPSATMAGGYVTSLWCDAARQLLIYSATVPGSSITTYYVTVLGWWDYRGKQD